MKFLRTLLFNVYCILTFLQGAAMAAEGPKSTASYVSSPFQIYSAKEPIRIKTKEDCIYTHVVGTDPDWHLCSLRKETWRSAPQPGDGQEHVYFRQGATGYHYVEETRLKGSISLAFEGFTPPSVHVTILKQHVLFLETSFAAHELVRAPQVSLPLGSYEMMVSAPGCELKGPIPFTLNKETSHLQIPISFQERLGLLEIRFDPPHVADGKIAKLRALDIKGNRQLFEQEIVLGKKPIELKEGYYTLELPPIAGYDLAGGSKIVGRFSIEAGKTYRIEGRYEKKKGSLEVTIKTDPRLTEHLHECRVNLVDESGNGVEYAANNMLKSHSSIKAFFNQVPPGNYEIFVESPSSLLQGLLKQPVVVKSAQTVKSEVYLAPTFGAVDLLVRFPGDEGRAISKEVANNLGKDSLVQLIDQQGEVVFKSNALHVVAEGLIPGKYTAIFKEIKNFEQPAPLTLEVGPNEQVGPLFADYERGKGAFNITFRAKVPETLLEGIKLSFVSKNQERVVFFRKGLDFKRLGSEEAADWFVAIPELPANDYLLEVDFLKAESLFSPLPPIPVTIVKGKVQDREVRLYPLTGKVEASVKLPDSYQGQRPTIALKDIQGMTVAASDSGTLQAEYLPAGQYTIFFSRLNLLEEPAPIPIDLPPKGNMGPFIGAYQAAKGSLEIHYYADCERERFERIRFWVINERNGRQLYPKLQDKKRIKQEGKRNFGTAIVENLTVGTYSIEFLIPNNDGLILPVPPRQVQITQGETAKLEVPILCNFARLDIQVEKEEAPESLKEGWAYTQEPSIKVTSEQGETFHHKGTSLFSLATLKPGTYKVEFLPLAGYRAPESQVFKLQPGEKREVVNSRYALVEGSVVISLSSPMKMKELQSVVLRLHHLETKETLSPDQQELVEAKNALAYSFNSVKAGKYRLEVLNSEVLPFQLEGAFRTLQVEPGKRAAASYSLPLKTGALEVKLAVPQPFREKSRYPKIFLKKGAHLIASSEGDQLSVKSLEPGDYQLSFAPVKGLKQMSPIGLVILPGKKLTVGPLAFDRALSSLIVNYQVAKFPELLEEISFKVLDKNGNEVVSKQSLEKKTYLKDNVKICVLDDLLASDYTIVFDFGPYRDLFPSPFEVHAELEGDKPLKIEQHFTPQLSSVDILVKSEQAPLSRAPKIQLKNEKGRIVATSTDGQLLHTELLPGRYQVLFENLKGFHAPAPLYIDVALQQKSPPVVGIYQQAKGKLSLRYTAQVPEEILEKTVCKIRNKGQVTFFQGTGTLALDQGTLWNRLEVGDIPPGDYELSFSYPDINGLFDEGKRSTFTITGDETSIMDQVLEPRLASVDIRVVLPPHLIKEKWRPTIYLKDEFGQVKAQATDTKLKESALIPGKYQINFETKPGLKPLPAIALQLKAGQTEVFKVEYQPRLGHLVLAYESEVGRPLLDKVKFKLKSSDGQEYLVPSNAYPVEKTTAYRRELTLRNLPEGMYTLEYSIPSCQGLFSEREEKKISINDGETTLLQELFSPEWAAVEVESSVPTAHTARKPKIFLKRKTGELVAISDTLHLKNAKLHPGSYLVSFEDSFNCETPKPLSIELEAGKFAGPFKVEYHLGKGDLTVSYDIGYPHPIVDQIKGTLRSSDGQEWNWPSPDHPVAKGLNASSRQVTFSNLKAGTYQVLLQFPEVGSLFPSFSEKTVEVNKGEKSVLQENLELNWAKVHVSARYEERLSDQHYPHFMLLNEEGQLQLKSEMGVLASEHLIPGKYKVAFEPTPGFITPPAEELKLTPRGKYTAEVLFEKSQGTLEISYQSDSKGSFLKDISFSLKDGENKEWAPATPLPLIGGKMKRVAIESLPPGNYELVFTGPAIDGLFELPYKETVKVEHGKVTSIHKTFAPRFAGVQVKAEFSGDEGLLEARPQALLQLKNEKGVVLQSKEQLQALEIVPGNYQVLFLPLPGWQAPEPISFSVTGLEPVKTIKGTYQRQKGDLLVQATIASHGQLLQSISPQLTAVRLGDQKGESLSFYPSEVKEGTNQEKSLSRSWLFKELPTGTYRLSLVSEGDFAVLDLPAAKEVEVKAKEKTISTSAIATKLGKIKAECELPWQAKDKRLKIALKDKLGQVVSFGENQLQALDLLPGTYQLFFEEDADLIAPKRREVTLEPNQELSLKGKYEMGRSLLTLFISADAPELLQSASFEIRNQFGDKREVKAKATEGGFFAVLDLVAGTYEMSARPIGGDFKLKAPQTIHLYKEQKQSLSFELEMEPGRIQIEAQVPEKMPLEEEPQITLLDQKGRQVASVKGKMLDADNLVPGVYLVTFGAVSPLKAPEQSYVMVEAREVKSVKGVYTYVEEELTIDLKIDPLTSQLEEWLSDILRQTFIELSARDFDKKISFFGEEIEKRSLAKGSFTLNLGMLPIGSYRLKVHFPTVNGLFEPEYSQDLLLKKGEPLKKTLTIKPKYAQLEAEVFGLDLAAKRGNSTTDGSKEALLTLVDSQGKTIIAEKGMQFSAELLPGAYTLSFGKREFYQEPSDLPLKLKAGQKMGPVQGRYQAKMGSLTLRLFSDSRKGISPLVQIVLTDDTGHKQFFPTKEIRWQKEQKEDRKGLLGALKMEIPKIRAGHYRLETLLSKQESHLIAPNLQPLLIASDQNTYFEQPLSSNFGRLEVESTFSTAAKPELLPFLTLIDLESQEERAISENGQLLLEKLESGSYSLIYGDLEDYETPAKETFTLNSGENKHLKGHYQLAKGNLRIAYHCQPKGERMEQIQLCLIDQEGRRSLYPNDTVKARALSANSYALLLSNLPVGPYQIEFLLPNDDGLYQPIPLKEIAVSKAQTTEVEQAIEVRYAQLKVETVFEEEKVKESEAPLLEVFTLAGQKVGSAKSLQLNLTELLPGKYRATFKPVSGFITPEPMEISLSAGQTDGKLSAVYQRELGSFACSFNVSGKEALIDQIGIAITKEGKKVLSYQPHQLIAAKEAKDGKEERREIGPLPLKIGSYQLEFFALDPNLFAPFKPVSFQIRAGQLTELKQTLFTELGMIVAALQLPPGQALEKEADSALFPTLIVEDSEGKVLYQGNRADVAISDLASGTYHIKLLPHPLYQEEKPLTVKLERAELSGPHTFQLKRATGSLEVNYGVKGPSRYIDEVELVLIDEMGKEVLSQGAIKEAPMLGGRVAKFEALAVGNYQLVFKPKLPNLFAVQTVPFTIRKGEKTLLSQSCELAIGKLSCKVQQVGGEEPLQLDVSIHEGQGAQENLIWQGKGNFIERELTQGSYILSFAPLEGFKIPEAIPFDIEPLKTVEIKESFERCRGDLKILYASDERGLFLDEVKIRIKGAKNSSQPIIEEVTEGSVKRREALFKDLPTGIYQVKFQVETSGALTLPPKQTIAVREGVTLLEQMLPLNLSTLHVHLKAPSFLKEEELPLMQLSDDQGKVLFQGKKEALTLEVLPGTYHLAVAAHAQLKNVEPLTVHVPAGREVKKVEVALQKASGHLELEYALVDEPAFVKHIKVSLVNAEGQTIEPAEESEHSEHVPFLRFSNLPTGPYRLHFKNKGKEKVIREHEKEVQIFKGETTRLNERLTSIFGALSVVLAADVGSERAVDPNPFQQKCATVEIRDAFGNLVLKEEQADFQHRLKEGSYEISCRPHEGYQLAKNSPSRASFTIEPGQEMPYFAFNLERKKGAAQITCRTNYKGLLLDQLQVKLIDAEQREWQAPLKIDREGRVPHVKQIFTDLPTGRYTVAFELPDVKGGGIKGERKVAIDIYEEQTTTLNHAFEISLGSLEAVAKTASKEIVAQPKGIKLQDSQGELIASADNGSLLQTELLPGKYTLIFEPKEGFAHPLAKTVEVAAGAKATVDGLYRPVYGTLDLSYTLKDLPARLHDITPYLLTSDGREINLKEVQPQMVIERKALSNYGQRLIVKKLPEGNYQVAYKVENSDQLIQAIGPKEVKILRDKTLKVEDPFACNFASCAVIVKEGISLLETAALPTLFKPKEKVKENLFPIKLVDSHGKVIAGERGEHFSYDKLLPGVYQIVFGRIPYFLEPRPLTLSLMAGEEKAHLSAYYAPAIGSLRISYEVEYFQGTLPGVEVILTNQFGESCTLSSENALVEDFPKGKQISIPAIMAGEYSVSFKGLEAVFPISKAPIKIQVDPLKIAQLNEVLIPCFSSVECSLATLPENSFKTVPRIYLVDPHGKKIATTAMGKLFFDKLTPGRWSLHFEELPAFETPSPIFFDVAPQQDIGPFIATYRLAKGSLSITYDTGPLKERLEQVRFFFSDVHGRKQMFPREFDCYVQENGLSKTVTINEILVGDYQIEFAIPNDDSLFKEVPTLPVTIRKGEETKIKQAIVPQYGTILASYDIEGDVVEKPPILAINAAGEIKAQGLDGTLEAKFLPPGQYQVVYPDIPGYKSIAPINLPLPPSGKEGPFKRTYRPEFSLLSLDISPIDREWALYQNGKVIKKGKGPISALPLPPGEGYFIKAEEVPGFDVQIEPKGTFALKGDMPLAAKIDYLQEMGLLKVEAALPSGEIATVTLTPSLGGPAIRKSLTASEGKMVLDTLTLPAGPYIISYELPPYLNKQVEEKVSIRKGEIKEVKATFTSQRKIHVSTNFDEALFTLKTADGQRIAQGKGKHYTFVNILPGSYQLSFEKPTKNSWIMPPEQTVIVAKDQDGRVQENYLKAASLILSSNADEFSCTIQAQDKDYRLENEKIHTSRTFTLPEGKYSVTFYPLDSSMAAKFGQGCPDPVEVTLRASRPERVHGIYEDTQGSLVVTTNLPESHFTVQDTTSKLVLGRYKGKYTVIPMTAVGTYQITFENVPNYQTPERILVEIKPGKRKTVGGTYLPQQKVVPVARGPAIIGDIFGDGASDERPARTVDVSEFLIGIYQVTNSQYASWLTKMLNEGKVRYELKAPNRGKVYDKEGHLLFKTVDSDPHSQIQAAPLQKGYVFNPVTGKQNHPVIEVSWYGANLYCQDNGFRLPTEAEWEKAAGMANTSLKKYRYGFMQNEIDKTHANYRDSYQKGKAFQVDTKEVGFYNGINLLENPTKGKEKTIYGTQIASSPFGCFDMSGNVREWVNDWYEQEYLKYAPAIDPQGPGQGTKKVTKGGSYNSFAYETRVSAKMPLSPETTDPYTGFRIVIDKSQ